MSWNCFHFMPRNENRKGKKKWSREKLSETSSRHNVKVAWDKPTSAVTEAAVGFQKGKRQIFQPTWYVSDLWRPRHWPFLASAEREEKEVKKRGGGWWRKPWGSYCGVRTRVWPGWWVHWSHRSQVGASFCPTLQRALSPPITSPISPCTAISYSSWSPWVSL